MTTNPRTPEEWVWWRFDRVSELKAKTDSLRLELRGLAYQSPDREPIVEQLQDAYKEIRELVGGEEV